MKYEILYPERIASALDELSCNTNDQSQADSLSIGKHNKITLKDYDSANVTKMLYNSKKNLYFYAMSCAIFGSNMSLFVWFLWSDVIIFSI